MSDLLDALEVLIMIAAMALGMGALIGIIEQVDFPGEAARIEQLRQDAARVNLQEAEDVMGQVTEANQKIVAAQRYNQIPILCLLVPNGWDRIKTIAACHDMQCHCVSECAPEPETR